MFERILAMDSFLRTEDFLSAGAEIMAHGVFKRHTSVVESYKTHSGSIKVNRQRYLPFYIKCASVSDSLPPI